MFVSINVFITVYIYIYNGSILFDLTTINVVSFVTAQQQFNN